MFVKVMRALLGRKDFAIEVELGRQFGPGLRERGRVKRLLRNPYSLTIIPILLVKFSQSIEDECSIKRGMYGLIFV